MFGLFRSKRQKERIRRELVEAKQEVKVQRLLLREALQALADAKSQKENKND